MTDIVLLLDCPKVKWCNKCKRNRPVKEFTKDRARLDGLQSYCGPCKCLSDRNHRANNLEDYRERDRWRGRKSLYGLTKEQYTKLLNKQNNCCAICKRESSGHKTHTDFSVDHCHETGKVRGLLCHACNAGIGFLKNSPKILKSAAKYLEQTNEQ